jgi:hypothetical protein
MLIQDIANKGELRMEAQYQTKENIEIELEKLYGNSKLNSKRVDRAKPKSFIVTKKRPMKHPKIPELGNYVDPQF